MLTLNYLELKSLCTEFNRIIPAKPPVAVLGNILFRVYDSGFSAEATNLDESLIFLNHSAGEPSGQVQIAFPNLKKILAGMKRGTSVTLTPVDDQIEVSYSSGLKLSFPFESEPMPVISTLTNSANSITLDMDQFISGYRDCALAASTDETRLVLNSVFFDSKDRVLVSTDGKRVIITNTDCSLNSDLVLPITKTLKNSKALTGEAQMTCDSTKFQIEAGHWSYTCKLLEGLYPNWRQVMVTPGPHSITLSNCSDTLSLIKQLASDTKEGSVTLRQYEKRLYAIVKSNGVLQSTPIIADCTTDTPEVTVDVKFICDALKACGETTTLYINDTHAPVLFRSKCDCIIMPLRGADSEVITAHLTERYSSTASAEIVSTDSPEPISIQSIPPKKSTTMSKPQTIETPAAPQSPLNEIFSSIDTLLEMQAQAHAKAEEAFKIIRNTERGLKALNRQVKAYEKSNSKKIKEFKQAQELIGKLQAIAS